MMFVGITTFVVVGFVLYKHFSWKALPWPAHAMKPPRYQGHRGFWKGGAKENTMDAFKAAAQKGLEMVELDVRLSKDLIPVVFHDKDLRRLGNSAKFVFEVTAAEIKERAKAPTLEEVLTSKEVPPKINIEIKTSAILDGRLEQKVAELILKHKAEDRVLFSSFNPLALWRLSYHLPQVPRALLASKDPEDPENKIYLRHLWLAPYVRVHALHLDHEFVSVNEVKRWMKRKVPVALWTVNNKEKALAYLEAGALSIISDTLGGSQDS
ncbi:glycerophosphodiester phosphodiesterase [Bdellovibrio sp. 22V]|uniref:glycerophosphodiester phosphodiesterase n=1 Tax=Bdellovibrio TaxID=958 RepID=UPI00254324CE|nr:glycerophosphodiester phosphodiesterase [Bdellovibrio sp. 22V]WII71567.1 glycerophosphodiester phosphodiesterase [Bdellovibrio sp. 22V]